MADMIQLHIGQPPWKPTPEAEIVEEYRYYDVPLAGVVRESGREFFFACLQGADETISLWWYVHITPEQRAVLESKTGADFDAALASLPFHGWGRLAFATTNLGIVDFEDADSGQEGVATALQALISRLDQLSADAKEFAVVQ